MSHLISLVKKKCIFFKIKITKDIYNKTVEFSVGEKRIYVINKQNR